MEITDSILDYASKTVREVFCPQKLRRDYHRTGPVHVTPSFADADPRESFRKRTGLIELHRDCKGAAPVSIAVFPILPGSYYGSKTLRKPVILERIPDARKRAALNVDGTGIRDGYALKKVVGIEITDSVLESCRYRDGARTLDKSNLVAGDKPEQRSIGMAALLPD